MSDQDRDRIEARLRDRAGEIADRRRELRGGDPAVRSGELADYDQHPADQGSETFAQEMDETTDMILAEEERQIHLAQQALEAGAYGKCVDCGREIPRERLEAIPESTRCIDDQRRYEAGLRASGPPPRGS